jgi:hypothetical protein
VADSAIAVSVAAVARDEVGKVRDVGLVVPERVTGSAQDAPEALRERPSPTQSDGTGPPPNVEGSDRGDQLLVVRPICRIRIA